MTGEVVNSAEFLRRRIIADIAQLRRMIEASEARSEIARERCQELVNRIEADTLRLGEKSGRQT